MNKKELVNIVSAHTGLTKMEVLKVLDFILEKVTDTLIAGESVRLVGFGAFEVRTRAARRGRDPNTGKEMKIASSKRAAFIPGKALKDAIRNKGSVPTQTAG